MGIGMRAMRVGQRAQGLRGARMWGGTCAGEGALEPRGAYIDVTPGKLVWMFAIGSIVGLVLEIVWHALINGEYQSRAGLVWGPFSPLYGVGMIALTLCLNRTARWGAIPTFMLAAGVGTAVELVCSFLLEGAFGVSSWDYSALFGSFLQGRGNVGFSLMWGFLGLAWCKVGMPALDRLLTPLDSPRIACRIVTVALACFLCLDAVVTVQALDRQAQRADGIAATTSYTLFMDQTFPDDWMHQRFENMQRAY